MSIEDNKLTPAASDTPDSDENTPSPEVSPSQELPAEGEPAGTAHSETVRMVEALLFAAAEPLDIDSLTARLPKGADVGAAIQDLQALYEGRGVSLVPVAGKWMFRTASDLSFLMEREAVDERKLSRAALETLAIIAYHQPVTRAEIEEIRGVSVSKGTLDVLLETEWVRLRGRRRSPGRPVTYGTTEAFLIHFDLESIGDLPGVEELKAAGLLDGRLPPGFDVPNPSADGGDGDGELEDDATTEEYGAALDAHLEAGVDAELNEPAEEAEPEPVEGQTDHGPVSEGDGGIEEGDASEDQDDAGETNNEGRQP